MILGRSKRSSDERVGTPADLLVVGLGNPGEKYAQTRHNVGADAVDLLADRHGARLKAGKQNARVAEVVISGKRLVLAVPLTFMNESGLAVQALVRRYGVTDPNHLVIIQDELDLEPGRMKVKIGGGLAGHNGLRSIRDHLDNNTDFVRLRIGVGKPPNPEAGRSWVLKKVSKAQREVLDDAVGRAADAVETILDEGPERAMNQYNSHESA